MNTLLWIAAGALLGMLEGAGGAVAGAALGGMIASLRKDRHRTLDQHDTRLRQLEHEVATLRSQLDAAGGAHPVGKTANIGTETPENEVIAAAAPPLPEASSALDEAHQIPAASKPAPHQRAAATIDTEMAFTAADAQVVSPDSGQRLATPPQSPGNHPVSGEEERSFDLDPIYRRCRDWLFGGNTLVRVGLLVLFFGLAFLARYAIEHTTLSPALRLSGIALFGLVLGTIGWRLRERRRGYALSLQGGAIAILYLSAFAALRLYALLPASTAFALMLVMVMVAAILAVRQDAAALAVIATAGGFAAPILASTGTGSHVQLFTYYALLNTGILALAWLKAWRGLNLTGFVFTFAIGLSWGAQFYAPTHFSTTEPFLILFFLMYVAATVAYAWRQAPRLRDPVDGTLTFGVPVVGFGLQAALVYEMPYALAWSAGAMGLFYLALAAALQRLQRPALSLLTGSFIALGITFLTLALPLAFDGRWSAAAWALEGAGLWWIGLRQQRRLAAAAGLLLQLGAAMLFAADLAFHPGLRQPPVLNSALLGTVLIAAAAFFSAGLAARLESTRPRLRTAAHALLAWAWLWWLGGALAEIDAHLNTGLQPAASLLLFALSGALACKLGERLQWPSLRVAGLLPLAGMLLALVETVGYAVPPTANLGGLAWGVGIAAHLYCARGLTFSRLERNLVTLAHAAGVWVLAFALSQEAGLRLTHLALGQGWVDAGYGLAPGLLLAALLWAGRGQGQRSAQWHTVYRLWGAAPLAAALTLWAIMVQFAGNGSAQPWSYLPLLNPLDVAVIATLAIVHTWLRTSTDILAQTFTTMVRLQAMLGAAAFIAFNGLLLRAIHHLGGIDWALDRLLSAPLTQATLSLSWAALGLAMMLFAGRRVSRPLWLAGAGLMAAVVIKLFTVDMAASGALARIVSFIGAGLVLLLVGYFSPLPPRQAPATTGPASQTEDEA